MIKPGGSSRSLLHGDDEPPLFTFPLCVVICVCATLFHLPTHHTPHFFSACVFPSSPQPVGCKSSTKKQICVHICLDSKWSHNNPVVCFTRSTLILIYKEDVLILIVSGCQSPSCSESWLGGDCHSSLSELCTSSKFFSPQPCLSVMMMLMAPCWWSNAACLCHPHFQQHSKQKSVLMTCLWTHLLSQNSAVLCRIHLSAEL